MGNIIEFTGPPVDCHAAQLIRRVQRIRAVAEDTGNQVLLSAVIAHELNLGQWDELVESALIELAYRHALETARLQSYRETIMREYPCDEKG